MISLIILTFARLTCFRYSLIIIPSPSKIARFLFTSGYLPPTRLTSCITFNSLCNDSTSMIFCLPFEANKSLRSKINTRFEDNLSSINGDILEIENRS